MKIEPLVIDDSDEVADEIVPFRKAKRIKRKILHTFDSDSDSSSSEDGARGWLAEEDQR